MSNGPIQEVSFGTAAADYQVRAELQPGERLLWTGRATRYRMPKALYFPVFFGMFFAGFALFWITMAAAGVANIKPNAQGGTPGALKHVFPLFGIPFLVVGLGVMGTPIWAKRKIRNNVYGITDRRAIVIQRSLFGSSTKLFSFTGEQLAAMERTQHEDGSGDIVFEKRVSGVEYNGKPQPNLVGFIGVEQVREVENTLRDALRVGTKTD